MILYAAHRVVELSTKQTFRSVFAPLPTLRLLLPFGPSLFFVCVFCFPSLPSRTACSHGCSLAITFTGILSKLIHHIFHEQQQQQQLGLVCFLFDFGVFFFLFFSSCMFVLKGFLTSPAIKPHTSKQYTPVYSSSRFSLSKCPSLSARSSSSSSILYICFYSMIFDNAGTTL